MSTIAGRFLPACIRYIAESPQDRMAVRIPVVISQHERRSGSIADYEEQLITRIVMESGLDATLIAELKSIELETTDHLCIEGLKGDFALATWESPIYVCTHLHRLGIPALEIIPVDGSPKTTSGDVGLHLSKKILLISLSTNMGVDATIKTLKDLLAARSTPVFSIGAPIHRGKPVAMFPETTEQPPRQKATSAEMPTEIGRNLKNRIEISRPTVSVVSENAEFPNIDQLMDELDQFEI
ncbi:MAG TPA: hypothetical protein VM260_14905 [Pirellula sp.]|nr:hypothetical protein [Pirellula sp.]